MVVLHAPKKQTIERGRETLSSNHLGSLNARRSGL
jgi:hypothetical protein